MIKPTIGRKLWYYANGALPDVQPEDATVVVVHNDHTVNLLVVSHVAVPRPELNIYLYQGDPGEVQPPGAHCVWMPYQKGQAATTEALQAQSKLSSTLEGTTHGTVSGVTHG